MLRERVESGVYFKYALAWYKIKYIDLISTRSLMILFVALMCLMISGITFQVYKVLPITKKLLYVAHSKESTLIQRNTNIIKAGYYKDPLLSISKILIENYVKKREQYHYSKLKEQITYIKNTSNRNVFDSFYESLDIKNPNSLLLKYQNNYVKNIVVDAIEVDNYEALIIFKAYVDNIYDKSKRSVTQYQVQIKFDIDQVDSSMKDMSRYNFIVTNYEKEVLQR
jgi:type IV secretory pathway component VirB8